MMNRFLSSLVRFLSTIVSLRRFTLTGSAACLVYAGCLVGSVGAQPLVRQKGTSPPFDPKQPLRSVLRAAPITANAPLSDTFLLHSRPSASKRIYLDFDGFKTTDDNWGATQIVTAAFTLDATPAFSNAELTAIQEIYERVAECFSPFDVDVTTEAPASTEDLKNTGGTDNRWGIRVAIGVSTPDPAPTAGGVAFLGSFNWDTDTPCYVFPQRLGNSIKAISDATTHEVGHTLGLDHHGELPDTAFASYYTGHGTGPTAWAPHMGVGYSVNLVQWSKGEYANANNFMQDDLAIISGGSNGFTYRFDDAANSQSAAGPIAGATSAGMFNINQSGVIEKTTDVDWFKITVGAGLIYLSAVGGPSNTMLDIQLDLYNSTGSLVATNNPADQLTAAINRTVAAGTYYVKIDGIGRVGDGLGSPPDQGYSDYGSLGQYRITGAAVAGSAVGGNVVASYNPTTKTLTLTGDANANSVTVTQKTAPDRIEVVGLTGTKVNNKTTVQTYPFTGPVSVGAVLGDGNDKITLTGLYASQIYLNLGNGDDIATLSYCFSPKLNVDGGTGTDVLSTVLGNTLPSAPPNRVVKNVP